MRRDTLKYLAKYRPDIKVVGDDLVPFGEVKDFSPYIAKVKVSGAQGLITGNAGADFNLLMHAAADAGLALNITPISATSPAALPPLVRLTKIVCIHLLEFHPNVPVAEQSGS